MKQVGDIYTARGQGAVGTVERITLFDGKFDTAFRLVSIEISESEPQGSREAWIKVMTEEADHTDTWDWGSNTEIGWACWNTPTLTRWGYNTFVDPDNLIVEDVFINFSGTDGPVNYMMTFQKYDISEWRGALAMVRNRSQT
jgi:hypothetical protein